MTTTLLEVQQKIESAQKAQIQSLEITYVETLVYYDISDLKKPTYNQRVLVDCRSEALTKSLKAHGFLGGVFINADNLNVIDGWHRCEQWQALGNTSIPCYLVRCTYQKEIELHLYLNQQAALFNLKDFGLEFGHLNLLDYGFSEADLSFKPINTQSQRPVKEKAPQPDGMTKLMAVVQMTTMDKLRSIKADQKHVTLGDTIEYILNLI